MSDSPLIGRERELGELRALLNEESGAALIVRGDPGVGKTALLKAVAREAREAGIRVLSATGVESESVMPYSGLHELIGPLLVHLDAVGLPQRQADAIATAFGVRSGQRPEPFLVALGTLGLMASVGRPLVVIDDAQWLDAATQQALAFVARRSAAGGVRLLIAARSGHETALDGADLHERSLTELDAASSEALLRARIGRIDGGSAARILETAAGNPLALVELSTPRSMAAASYDELDGTAPLTTRLERAFGTDASRLSAGARDLLLIAAVDDAADVMEVLAAAAAHARKPIDEAALDEARAGRLITVEDGRIRFRHPLVRSGILHAETRERRRAAHAALATALVAQPYRRAWHRALATAGPDETAADELESAHATALGRGSAAVAIHMLVRAAELTATPAKRVRRLLLAAEHAFGLGRADLVERYVAAAERSELSALDLARVRWLREIFNDGVPGDAARVFELCDSATLAFDEGEHDLGLDLLLAAALRCWWADSGRAAQARIVEVAERESSPQHGARFVAILAVAEPVRRGERVMQLLDRMPAESVSRAEELHLLGMAAHAVGDPPRAVDYLRRAETGLREEGRVGLLAQAIVMQIPDANHLGEWARARAAVAGAQSLAQATGQPIWNIGASVLAAAVFALHGETQRALDIASDAELSARGRALNNLLACAQLARGFAFAANGRYADSYDALSLVFDPGGPCRTETERFHAIGVFVEAAVHCGHVERARKVVEELEDVALLTPAPALHVELGYARALVASPHEQEAAFRVALGEDLTRWPWCQARLQFAFGAWLRRHRRAGESRALLRSAAAGFEAIGATFWRDQAREELRAAGEAPMQASLAATEHLTAQEIQIARLAAQGLSNREIGERLYLSPRTVGSHLYRIFPKVGVTSRAQLAQWMATTPAPPVTAPE